MSTHSGATSPNDQVEVVKYPPDHPWHNTMTAAEAAAYTGMHRTYIYFLLGKGRIPGAFKPKGLRRAMWRLPVAAVQQLLLAAT